MNTVIQELEEVLERLEEEQVLLKIRVDGARRNQEQIFPRIERWLRKMDEVIADNHQFLDLRKNLKQNRGILYYVDGSKVSKVRTRISEVRMLIAEANALGNVSYTPAPVEGPKEDLESISDVVMDTLKDVIGFKGMDRDRKASLVHDDSNEAQKLELLMATVGKIQSCIAGHLGLDQDLLRMIDMSLVFERSCQQFSFDEIQKATDKFDESKVIGKGGFGKVYKGVVRDGSTTSVVAMKRLNPESKQGVVEFRTEIKTLSRFRHCNLVALVGYCYEPPEMILVYEYMPHGTLADHLFKMPDSSLTWTQRLKICIGVARGLDYLHTGTGISSKVIHRDVKSANILLDENWAAKISDLGLSKMGVADQPCSEVITNVVKGTPGYIDPEYRKSHKISRKTDVYAFGVVLLEVLTGTRAWDGGVIPEHKDLDYWTQQHIRNQTLNQIIDKRVRREISPKCSVIFANIASKSLHNNTKKRPTMSEVVANLEFALACQEGTNPSSTIVDEELLQHFNAFHESINT